MPCVLELSCEAGADVAGADQTDVHGFSVLVALRPCGPPLWQTFGGSGAAPSQRM
jgi:hypothetical protein